MKNIFNSIKLPPVNSNKFDLSHDVKLSFSMGELIPTCCMEAIPGDMFEINVENMLRFAPLISPVMHQVKVTTHYFFVPNRIVWPGWEKWITGESNVLAPFVDILEDDFPQPGGLADYLGYPAGAIGPVNNIPTSAIPIAAYAKIYNEYYRDQNLQTELVDSCVDGDNGTNLLPWWNWSTGPLKRAWEHDYFTAALPFAQKGAAVQIPLTSQTNIPVEYDNPLNNFAIVRNAVTDAPLSGGVNAGTTDGSLEVGLNNAALDPNGTLTVDVQAGATDINTLRRAFRLQEWLERNARGGTRYVENILSHFGVKSSDARLQRPEYIGGGKQNMVISEVLATAESTNQAVGQMAGHGISVGGSRNFRYRAEEHGYVIGIINVQPTTAYQQGLHKSLTRFDRLDYAWPTFANLGEQPVLNSELLLLHPNPDSVFGYVPRYADYKFMNSRVSGEFRTTLSFWHLGRIFNPALPPALNSAFITADPSTRIFAVTDPDEDHIYAHVFNNIKVRRKLPMFGIPTI